MTRRSDSEMANLIASDLYGGERFFAAERRRIEREFFKAHQPKGKKRASYGDRLRERFEMKRKAK